MFATGHFRPDVLWMDFRRDPEDDKIVEEIGALSDHGVGVTSHGVDHYLDRFLGQLLAQLPRPARNSRAVDVPGSASLAASTA